MTHNEKRTVWWKEGLMGAVVGFQYGLINVAVGHPFDTLKTKMQVQSNYKHKSFLSIIKDVYKVDGVKGFYRGATSIVIGSGLFRSAQFSSFEGFHSRFEPANLKGKDWEKFFTYKLKKLGDLQVSTFFAGLFSGVFRSVVECPFEHVKINKQVKNKVSYNIFRMYEGLFPLIAKNAPMIAIGFSMIDILRRNTDMWKSSIGVFFASGFSTLFCHLLIWPIEVFRNNYMAKSKGHREKFTVLYKKNVKELGFFRGTFRGALPGLISTFLRNGIALAALQKIQKFFTYIGARG